MKHTKSLLITFLFLCMAVSLSAQQGNVAAGGDATGTGGSISYSIGQTDYLICTSGQGIISLGLQQPSLYSLPLEFEIPEIIISDGEVLCFNTEETVIIAGYGKHFTFQDGGHADIIAGINIVMKQGTTTVEHGGTLHAYLSDVFCNVSESLLASFEEQIQPEPGLTPALRETFFKVYPNLTTGDFTLEIPEFEASSALTVDIYTIQGHLILSRELPVEQRYTFSLAGMLKKDIQMVITNDNAPQFGAKIIRHCFEKNNFNQSFTYPYTLLENEHIEGFHRSFANALSKHSFWDLNPLIEQLTILYEKHNNVSLHGLIANHPSALFWKLCHKGMIARIFNEKSKCVKNSITR
jgi:hypothetical protein